MVVIAFFVFGALAQLVDGAIGMGFGIISSTLLLSIGVAAATASASIHLAEIATTFTSGIAHWRLGNVDSAVLARIAIPGAIGAFAGATFLSRLDLSSAKSFVSAVLLVLGFFILYRVLRPTKSKILSVRQASPVIGLFAGFVDAAGGGGWGPIATPAMLSLTAMEPRRVVGTVNAAEFLVAVSASLGFLLHLDRLSLDWEVVLGLALGGMVAAPIAARIVSRIPRIALGVAIGLGVVAINSYQLLVL